MEMLEQAAQLFTASGCGTAPVEHGPLKKALQELIGTRGNDLNIAGLLVKLIGNGMPSLARSWLADGANEPISGAQVTALLGDVKVALFAAQLGLTRRQAADGLAFVLPRLIDANSRHGRLLNPATDHFQH